MSDDTDKLRPVLKGIIGDMSKWRLTLPPDYLSFPEQVIKSLGPISQRHLEFARAMEVSSFASSQIAELAKASQHWQGLAGGIAAAGNAIVEMSQPHSTWLEGLSIPDGIVSNLDLQIKGISSIQLANVAYRTTITENIFAGIDFGDIQEKFGITEPILHQLQEAINNMTDTYGSLAMSLNDLPDVVALPAYSLPGASRELFLTGHALQTIWPTEDQVDEEVKEHVEEVRQETAGCRELLYSIEPALVGLYAGAYNAFNSDNADKARHTISSLRELWSHLLRCLAPDEEVTAWARSLNDKNLLHEGQPTRRARVLYVCRYLNHKPLSEFVAQDTKALVGMMEVFHRVHALEPNLTDDQLYTLLLRSDSWISYLLHIHKEGEQGF